MISAWWLLAAFIVGGYAGILLMALMYFASDHPDRDQRLARTL